MWTVPKIWEGGECWIIGGGFSILKQFSIPKSIIQDVVLQKISPSVYSEFLKPLHTKHVIGINNAYQIGNWVDILFFGDCSWYLVHRLRLSQWDGIKVTCCDRFANRQKKDMEGIKYLAKDRRHFGISENSSMVAWNGNSGAAAISLAFHLGVKRVILLGFDMRLGENQISHWHGSHQQPGEKRKRPLPFEKHLRCFLQISKDAERLGLEILNANPGSMIDEFPKVALEEIL